MTDKYTKVYEGGINVTEDEGVMDPNVRERVVNMDGLKRQQINQCLMEVEDMHPLRSEHITDIIPPLKCFQSCGCLKKKRNFRDAMRVALIAELREEYEPKKGEIPVIPKNEEHQDGYPFMIAGYGVNSFFDIMKRLVFLFLFITLVSLPVLGVYSRNTNQGVRGLETESWKTMLNVFSLGNMGGASTQCITKRLKVEEGDAAMKAVLSCPNGAKARIVNSKTSSQPQLPVSQTGGPAYKFGVMADGVDERNYCQNDLISTYKDPETGLQPNKDVENCAAAALFDTDYIHTEMERCGTDEAANAGFCEIPLIDDQGRFLFYKGKPAWNAEAGTGIPSEKCGNLGVFFLQYACELPGHTGTRQILGLYVACTAIFIYFYATVFFDYIRAVEATNQLDYDVKTYTAGDYSVEFKIQPQQYKAWEERGYHDESNPMSEMAQFKLYIQSELEKRLTEMPNLGYEDKDEIKIAQITFAYHNEKVINWLKKRGSFIQGQKWEKLDAIEAEIVGKLCEKDADGAPTQAAADFLDVLQTPCTCVCTFESEEGLRRAEEYNAQVNFRNNPNPNAAMLKYDHFLGLEDGLKIKEVSEPTDIIWQNRAITNKTRVIRRSIVYLIILGMLAISGYAIFTLSITSLALKLKYPPKDCLGAKGFLISEYGPAPEAADGLDNYIGEMQKDAVDEFGHAQDHKSRDLKESHPGYLQCYCDYLKKNKLKDKLQEKVMVSFTKYSYTHVLNPATGKKEKEQHKEDVNKEMKLCWEYQKDVGISKILGQSVAFFIIAVNTILKTVIIKLIQWISEDTHSKQLTSITNMVFIAQFFNTGILLLLVNANLAEHTAFPAYQFIQFGQFYDYAPLWYIDVGFKLVQTQLIAVFVPYGTTIGTGIVVPILKKYWDSKKTMNHFITRKKSRSAFKAIYSGSDYVIHFKYSGVLNIVYIAFFYGIGLPLLFPIAALSIFTQWVNERFNVAYINKLPPTLDDKLTNNAINMLKWAPLLLCFNGYWMLSNQQIFNDNWTWLERTDDQMKSNHVVSIGVNWAIPLFLVAFISVFVQCMQRCFQEKLSKIGFGMASKQMSVDEDLPNFFEIINMRQRNQMVTMYNNMKENFGFEYTDPDTIQAILDAPYPQVTIVGTPWYNVLSNPSYMNEFGFVPSYVSEREKIINDGYTEATDELTTKYKMEQSDFVMVMLQLAYIPDVVIQKIDFTKAGWSYKFKEAMDDFKANFEKVNGEPWKFQDEFTEERYIQHKEKIDAESEGFAARNLTDDEMNQIRNKQEEFAMSQSGIMNLSSSQLSNQMS